MAFWRKPQSGFAKTSNKCRGPIIPIETSPDSFNVIPAKAGIHVRTAHHLLETWVPAGAGTALSEYQTRQSRTTLPRI